LLIEAVRGKRADDFILTRKGNKPVKDMRAAWRNMCVRAGQGQWLCRICLAAGKEIELAASAKKCERCGSKATIKNRKYRGTIRHDMLRSAAKEARLAGVPESTIQDMGGWKDSRGVQAVRDRQQCGSDSSRGGHATATRPN
jgi:hypothetical protein